jgi:hypothetical protein
LLLIGGHPEIGLEQKNNQKYGGKYQNSPGGHHKDPLA